ncbi:collagen-like protein [Candidatus Marinimicrobia bacterium MT.SAG.3]|nr:collagen-like protein [Candidatus Marinimicrobia bacterium MT.SAG.3]
MKVAYILLIPLLLVACEGPVGPAGDQGIMGITGVDGIDGIDGTDGQQGIQGEPGAGTRTVYTGALTSDDMNIFFPDITTDIQTIPIIDVYACPTGFECAALPFTIEGVVTATYSLRPETVNLKNLLSLVQIWASTGIYIIVMVE